MSLFVGCLGDHVSREELEDLFSKYGRLTRCDMKQGRRSGSNFAFVEYQRESDATDALRELNGIELQGKPINIEWSSKQRNSCASGGEPRFGHSQQRFRHHPYRGYTTPATGSSDMPTSAPYMAQYFSGSSPAYQPLQAPLMHQQQPAPSTTASLTPIMMPNSPSLTTQYGSVPTVPVAMPSVMAPAFSAQHPVIPSAFAAPAAFPSGYNAFASSYNPQYATYYASQSGVVPASGASTRAPAVEPAQFGSQQYHPPGLNPSY